MIEVDALGFSGIMALASGNSHEGIRAGCRAHTGGPGGHLVKLRAQHYTLIFNRSVARPS